MKLLITIGAIILFAVSGTAQIKKTVSTELVGSRTFIATAYALKGRMANGQIVHQGAIAADPRVLPLGTRVFIDGMGIFIVKDTGRAIKGLRVDIWMPSVKQARMFGRRKVKIKIL